MGLALLGAIVFYFSVLSLSYGSYLDVPRIHFTGYFRADVNTRNNDNNTFSLDYLNPNQNADWNFNGTNEISFFNGSVKSVDFSESSAISEDDDPVLSASIVNNMGRTIPKLNDLDVDVQDKSTIYGMKFGVGWYEDGKYQLAFMGKWTPAVIAQDMWPRLKCFTDKFYGDRPQGSLTYGSQGTTILTDIEWGTDLKNSSALEQLKEKCTSGSGKLSIRVSYYYYPRNYGARVPFSFALGFMVGSIGVYEEGETLNFGGDRLLTSDNASPPQLSFDETDSCYEENAADYNPWTSNAPFELQSDENGNREVVVDLSNALPIDTNGNQRNIGELYLAYEDSSADCIYIIQPDKPIPYMESDWLSSGALVTYSLTESEHDVLVSNPLLVIQKVEGNTGDKLCGQLPSAPSESGIIVLKEREYFIRPLNYYVDRLEYQGRSSPQTLLVTQFGNPVSVDVKVSPATNVIPAGGVAPTESTSTSDNQGHVTFTFQVAMAIPFPRYYTATETKPIDGQVYYYNYCVIKPGQTDCTSEPGISPVTFLAFSTVSYTKPYTWVDDVEPIFAQFAHLHPVMKDILDLSNFTDVTLPWNIKMTNHSMLLDFNDPSFMPVTRDLSPTKTAMILEWLKNPIYSKTDPTPPGKPGTPICQHPPTSMAESKFSLKANAPRCEAQRIPYDSDPKDFDPFFLDVFKPTEATMGNRLRRRPLFGLAGLKDRKKIAKICTVEQLREQLLGAMQVEFYTIPVYLTSLYSIVEGCNHEIYTAIREVVMQEMMHFAQAANMLIAVGGDPDIDNPTFVPTYPKLGLPGGVLPRLYVTINKLSLEHVYRLFMGIEVPAETFVGGDEPQYANNTIGQFYEEVDKCIQFLPDSIFDPESVSRQVSWPWPGGDYIGHLLKVKDKITARLAIKQITDQGEGASSTNPNSSIPGEYAHFYRFEEIVCEKRLVSHDDDSYSYTGAPIPFDDKGVWNMRDNPASSSIKADTNCYTEAKIFHEVYRAFLRKLDEVFSCETSNCDPQALLLESIELMEDLQVHAKKLMWIKFDPHNPDDERTCGPVWDYEWNGPN